jgi:hypothetical protein
LLLPLPLLLQFAVAVLLPFGCHPSPKAEDLLFCRCFFVVAFVFVLLIAIASSLFVIPQRSEGICF